MFKKVGHIIHLSLSYGLPLDLLVRILSLVPLGKSKLALLSLGKAWYAALTDPEVHSKCRMGDDWTWGRSAMGPDAPRLQAAILAFIPVLHVQAKNE
eukprot:jgi/Astpho2/6387/Aster-06049